MSKRISGLCERCSDYSCMGYCQGVDVCEDFKPLTNADRIRAMSDEELAEWLEDHCYQYGWLDWLKAEVE